MGFQQKFGPNWQVVRLGKQVLGWILVHTPAQQFAVGRSHLSRTHEGQYQDQSQIDQVPIECQVQHRAERVTRG